jgi:ribosomal protein S18 acetylase RimI-like enzyme
LGFKGQRIGERLVVSALSRAVEGARQVASWAVVTDPKDEAARRFYESFGFRPLTHDRLFLPMKEAAALLTVR